MTLVLRGVTLNEEPISQPLVGRFDERGGSVGRSDEATLTLPDPERMISRIQAQVLHQDDRYWIENVSTVSPILHNGRPLSNGMRVFLQEGDEIRIGGYALEAAFESDAASATILSGRTVIPAPKGSPPAAKAAPAPPPPAPPAMRAPESARGADPAGTLAEPLHDRYPPQSPPEARQGADASALWRAFVEGAGIELSPPGGPTPQLLASIGEMMRIAVDGIQRLITMRARAKSEIQAEMTMIRPRDNNPLKFSPDAVLALQMLLQPPARGFLPGPAALRDAVTDLQTHQVGMTAGMRAILEAVLDRLDPAKLEGSPAGQSVLERLGQTRRKARLWETYVAQYHALREESQDNFQRFFGAAFREAYEAQVRNIDAADEPGVAARPRDDGAKR